MKESRLSTGHPVGAEAAEVDRTLLRENLKLTVTERFRKHRKVLQFVEKLRTAGKQARGDK